MEIEVDRDKCVGAGQCVLNAPDVFDQGEDDGIVELLDARPPRPLWTAAQEAAAACPAAVISLKED
ncbi:ferredoxin [Streptomyces minutiscleroticus]|uniref:Ferredoxin n=1 Tax=Streptomyces minutiscleroticus TaxID=68238 RepID=A0A918NR88_9ACTN|nr:ferredoxin [Streptomyces minutiscleroticus]GGX89930.1 ferredoxin [Streptomyces minutiscleroticus]